MITVRAQRVVRGTFDAQQDFSTHSADASAPVKRATSTEWSDDASTSAEESPPQQAGEKSKRGSTKGGKENRGEPPKKVNLINKKVIPREGDHTSV